MTELRWDLIDKCNIPNTPSCEPNRPQPPVNPPPTGEPGCPTLPFPEAPPVQGVLAAFGIESAAEAFEEDICLRDTVCQEHLSEEADIAGDSSISEISCLCRKKKYCLEGTIDYERTTGQHELGQRVSASKAESCTTISASAGFVGSEIEIECPVELECPCADAEFPPGICDEEPTAVEPLEDCDLFDEEE